MREWNDAHKIKSHALIISALCAMDNLTTPSSGGRDTITSRTCKVWKQKWRRYDWGSSNLDEDEMERVERRRKQKKRNKEEILKTLIERIHKLPNSRKQVREKQESSQILTLSPNAATPIIDREAQSLLGAPQLSSAQLSLFSPVSFDSTSHLPPKLFSKYNLADDRWVSAHQLYTIAPQRFYQRFHFLMLGALYTNI